MTIACWPMAVTMATRAVGSSLRISLRAARPSISGIVMSMSTASGGCAGVRGRRLGFDERGPADASGTLVLVHGLGSSRHIWDLVAPELASKYRVLALDQRGHGESDEPDTGYDFPSIVADLAEFLDA